MLLMVSAVEALAIRAQHLKSVQQPMDIRRDEDDGA